MNIIDIQSALGAWARWKLSGGVMPNSCTLGRLNSGGRTSVPGSRPPPGVEMQARVAAIIEGMEILPYFQDIYEPLLVVRLIYLRDEGKELKDVAAALDMSLSNLLRLRKIGEAALLSWVASKDYQSNNSRTH